jgi:lysyl-tRNA synthetase class 2
VETRTLQTQAGGAMAKVFTTHHNALDHEFVLRISLELEHKMLLAGRFERVFEIGKCIRNEGIDPSHLQEFTLLEWYAAYADITDNMNWTQEMIQEIVPKVLGGSKCTVLDKNEKQVEIDWGGTWKRVKFGDLLKQYAKIDMEKITIEELRTYAVKNCELGGNEARKMGRGNLLDHIYKKTARPQLIQPTFVTDWPTDLKPLARPNEDGTSDVYQLLVAGWEIVNSYGELIDPRIQRKLLETQAAAKSAGDEEAMEVDEEFLTAMEQGFPPMTGFGMGIDRFIALITGQPNLRDVVLFPLMRPEEK